MKVAAVAYESTRESVLESVPTLVNMPARVPTMPGMVTKTNAKRQTVATPTRRRTDGDHRKAATIRPTAAQMMAEREMDRTTDSAMTRTGVQRRTAERARSTSATLTASGSSIVSTAPNSIGCSAVPEGRLKLPRLLRSPSDWLATSPGIEMRSIHSCPVKNWTRPTIATIAPPRIRRRTSVSSRAWVRTPPSVATRTLTHDRIATMLRSAVVISLAAIGRVIANT